MEAKIPTVLVVDDEAVLRNAIVFDLKRQGYAVLDAGNGREAMKLVTDYPVDVVLTDVKMPILDGIQLLDLIKERNPSIPVVMLITGFADISLEEAYARGAAAVFSKPFDRKRLLDAIKRALTSKEVAWAWRHEERVPVDFNVKLNVEAFHQIIEGHIVNIGRGGMFVAMSGPLPEVDSPVDFSIQFNEGNVKVMEGTGFVRWVRSQNDGDKRAGCGIEFDTLDDASRQAVIELIQRSKGKAFIPQT